MSTHFTLHGHFCVDASDVQSTHDVRIDPESGLCVIGGASPTAAGAVASKIAVWAIHEPFVIDPLRSACNALSRAVEQAHLRIAPVTGRAGTGATVAAVRASGQWVEVVHVGRCRVYRLNRGHLHRLTEDHTLAHHLERQGRDLEEITAENPSLLQVVTESMGAHNHTLKPGHGVFPAHEGDLYVLCNHEVHTVLDEARIAELVLERVTDPKWVCDRLIHAARAAGGQGELTVACVQITAQATEREVLSHSRTPPPKWLYAPDGLLDPIPGRFTEGAEGRVMVSRALLEAVMGPDL
ncbi:MAG: PP2C family protein-serine/threonine phosphatase [Bradymonadia bacterium]